MPTVLELLLDPACPLHRGKSTAVQCRSPGACRAKVSHTGTTRPHPVDLEPPTGFVIAQPRHNPATTQRRRPWVDEGEPVTTSADTVTRLRLLVGYLGETAGWWSSQFYRDSSRMFLEPVFVRSFQQARLTGVTAAAARVHDEYIGAGRTLHLYRMPEILEQQVASAMADTAWMAELAEAVVSDAQAQQHLAGMADDVESVEGPVLVGELTDDPGPALAKMAGHYLSAFQSGRRTYPYLRDRS